MKNQKHFIIAEVNKMEGELIIVALISTIGTLGAIQLMNKNWFLRQDHRLENTIAIKKLELQHKKSMRKLGLAAQKPASKAAGLDLGALKGLWDNLNPDMKQNLIESFTGEGYNIPSESEDILSTILDKVPPDVIKGFVDKLATGTGQQQQVNFED